MNIITCIKQVPGTSQVEVDPTTGVLKRDGIESKLNPYDLFALEAALSLADKAGGQVKTLTMGPPQAKAVLSESLWMGADEAVLLTDRKFGGADVAATSRALAYGIRAMGDFDLILCGKQTTDGDTAQVGPELAENLQIDHAANVVEILEVDEVSITVLVDLETKRQTLKMQFPCLLTMEKDANTPRLPSYKRKKQASKEENIKVLTFEDLENAKEENFGLKGSPTQVERIFPPDKNKAQVILQGDDRELAGRLFQILRDNKFI